MAKMSYVEQCDAARRIMRDLGIGTDPAKNEYVVADTLPVLEAFVAEAAVPVK